MYLEKEMTGQSIGLDFLFPLNFRGTINLDKMVLFEQRDELLLQAYVPGIKIAEPTGKKNSASHLFTVNHHHSKNKRILQKEKDLFIFDDWSEEIPLYLFHLIYSICHKTWLENDCYAVHSACVGKNNSWSLLVGHSGVGKTTVMLDLLNNHGWEMFSSNKTLLKFNQNSSLETLAGTTTITCRESDRTMQIIPINPEIIFLDRFMYTLPEKYSQPKQKNQIKKIYLIGLNPAVKEYEQLNNFEALVALYPFFLDCINYDILLFKGSNLYDGTPSDPEIKKRLLKNMKKQLHSLDVYSLKGSLDFVSNIINEQL